MKSLKEENQKLKAQAQTDNSTGIDLLLQSVDQGIDDMISGAETHFGESLSIDTRSAEQSGAWNIWGAMDSIMPMGDSDEAAKAIEGIKEEAKQYQTQAK